MLDAPGIIQTALTPVFLLAGMAGFLNVFVSRLARVSDRVNELNDMLASDTAPADWRIHQLYYLRRRTLALEGAVVLTTSSGVFTCLATLGLLIGAMKDEFRAHLLLWLFGIAVTLLVGAFASFLVEMVAAGSSMLRQLANDRLTIRARRRQTLQSRLADGVPDGPRSTRTPK